MQIKSGEKIKSLQKNVSQEVPAQSICENVIFMPFGKYPASSSVSAKM